MAVTNENILLITTAQTLGLSPDNFLLLLQQSAYNQVNGITANYTVASGINYVSNGTLAGDTAVTLPRAATVPGQAVTVKATGSLGGHAFTVASADDVDGSASFTLSAQYKYVVVVSDGTTWNIVANN